jgi:hypothetical protein
MKKHLTQLIAAIAIAANCLAQDTTMRVQDTTMMKATDTILTINEPIQSVAPEDVPVGNPRYKVNLAVDIPLTAVTCGVTMYGFSKIYNRDRLTAEEVLALDPQNVNRFDRSATRNFDEKWSKIGDYLFYGSQPLPLVLLFDKRMRKDFPRILLVYLETMGITGVPYVSAVSAADRIRPYAYNPEASMDFRTRGGVRNSFYAGHPALVATSTFFMASTICYYHPESKVKWLYYTLAGAATATTAIARYKGGRHFPTDLMVGVAMGTLAGNLVPHFHRNKDYKKRKTTFMPYYGNQSTGIAVVHKF